MKKNIEKDKCKKNERTDKVSNSQNMENNSQTIESSNGRINIGLFIDTYYPMIDGVVTVVDNYAKILSEKANVIVFCPKMSEEYDDSKFEYQVVRCKSIPIIFLDYSLPTPKLDKKFKESLKNYNLDIIHIHSPFTLGKTAVEYAKENDIPVIATVHSQYKQDLQKYVKSDKIATALLNKNIMSVFNKCDECWAVNSEVARIFYEEYGYKVLPRVMNNATEMKLLVGNEKAQAYDYINEKYNIGKDDKVFLFVGRINTLKNILFIADALKILKKSHPDFKFKMLYVGSGHDEDKLQARVNDNGLQDDVVLCGRTSDRYELAQYYARADLFLFPSLYDASSIVQIEAASQKTPGVFLEGAATAATITNGRNGYIVKNDVEAYAEKIYEIFGEEFECSYDEVCENAYKEIYVSWEEKVNEAYELYINAIKTKRK